MSGTATFMDYFWGKIGHGSEGLFRSNINLYFHNFDQWIVGWAKTEHPAKDTLVRDFPYNKLFVLFFATHDDLGKFLHYYKREGPAVGSVDDRWYVLWALWQIGDTKRQELESEMQRLGGSVTGSGKPKPGEFTGPAAVWPDNYNPIFRIAEDKEKRERALTNYAAPFTLWMLLLRNLFGPAESGLLNKLLLKAKIDGIDNPLNKPFLGLKELVESTPDGAAFQDRFLSNPRWRGIFPSFLYESVGGVPLKSFIEDKLKLDTPAQYDDPQWAQYAKETEDFYSDNVRFFNNGWDNTGRLQAGSILPRMGDDTDNLSYAVLQSLSDMTPDEISQEISSAREIDTGLTRDKVNLLKRLPQLALEYVPEDMVLSIGSESGARAFCTLLEKAGLAKNPSPKDKMVYATYLYNVGKLDKVLRKALKEVDKYTMVAETYMDTERRYARFWDLGVLYSGCLSASDAEIKEFIRTNRIPRDLLRFAQTRGDLCKLINGWMVAHAKDQAQMKRTLETYWTSGGEVPVVNMAKRGERAVFREYRSKFRRGVAQRILGELTAIGNQETSRHGLMKRLDDIYDENEFYRHGGPSSASDDDEYDEYEAFTLPKPGSSGKMPFSGRRSRVGKKKPGEIPMLDKILALD